MKIFLAGATGVIDRELLPVLLAAGHEVAASSRGTRQAKRYSSLSAIAQEVTGTKWNGVAFFGLAKDAHAARQ